MSQVKILAFAGSTRTNSVNQQLCDAAAASAEEAGAAVTRLKLADYPLPLFDQDLEAEGAPDGLKELHQIFCDHDGLLIASPEYNSSLTPLLKNTIDWVSRPVDGGPPLAGYKGKVAGLLAASPGGLGGLRGLVHVRSILQNIGVIVVPDQLAVSRAFEAFNDSGQLKDENLQGILNGICKSVVDIASKLK